MDVRHPLHKYKQQKDRGGDCLHGFSSEAMAKGYQTYKDSWATVLSEKIPCLREVGNQVNFSFT